MGFFYNTFSFQSVGVSMWAKQSFHAGYVLFFHYITCALQAYSVSTIIRIHDDYIM